MNNILVNDIINWDVKSWSMALKYWEDNIHWDNAENILELGGRQGGLSLWTALKNKKTICSDLTDTEVTAKQLHSKYDISKFIKYQDIDATNIPYENFFDIIMFKSILGGIGRNDDIEKQKKVFYEIHKALKKGGKLLFAENLTASLLHQKLRKRFVNWGDYWRYITIREMEIFLEKFSSYGFKTSGFLGAFGRNEKQRQFLATIDNALLNKICPDNWNYIIYGIAEK